MIGKRMTRIILLLPVLGCLAGCAHGDAGLKAQTVAIIEKNLVVGNTTEQHALEMFGQPRHTETQGVSDIWIYDLNTVHMSPTDVMPIIQLLSMRNDDNIKSLRLEFDAAKRLKGWTYVETNLARYQGL